VKTSVTPPHCRKIPLMYRNIPSIALELRISRAACAGTTLSSPRNQTFATPTILVAARRVADAAAP
jgi:hypothetical protein